jgi:hypothetical protein
MARADLISTTELRWSTGLARRRAIYDRDRRTLVYAAAYVLPAVRCRAWARRHGYRLRSSRRHFGLRPRSGPASR